MNPNKNTSSARPELKKGVTGSSRAGSIESNTMRPLVEADAVIGEESTPETLAKHIERQMLRAFFDAVSFWRLDDSDAALLVGVEPVTIGELKGGKAPTNEEVLARMSVVALIRKALDIVFSPSLAAQWMTLPNSGYPYLGLSPVAYVGEHGWPGLYWVLRQAQARAVGN